MTMTCSVCGKMFVPTKKQLSRISNRGGTAYCSADCYEHRRIGVLGIPEIQCSFCGKMFVPKAIQYGKHKAGNMVFCSRECCAMRQRREIRDRAMNQKQALLAAASLAPRRAVDDEYCQECGGICLPAHQRRRRALDQHGGINNGKEHRTNTSPLVRALRQFETLFVPNRALERR